MSLWLPPRAVALSGLSYVPVALTLSGNEITDTTRTTGTEGDGRTAPDSSMGIWPATTNLVTNGGFETNTTGWTDSGSTTSRITTQYKFGVASGQVVTNNAAANEGPYHAFTGAAATAYTVSAWVRGASGTVRVALYDNVSGKQGSSAVTLSTTWQRVSVTATTGGGAATFRVYVETDVQQSITFQIDGVQVEAKPVATPYVHTDGGTATRSAARVQAPASLLDETQGWLALRVRMGWASGTNLFSVGNPSFFCWGSGTDLLQLAYINPNIHADRIGGGGNTPYALGGKTWASGDTITPIFAWTASLLRISFNGGAFTTNANTRTASIAASTFDIGDYSAVLGQSLCGDVLWAACGTGTLTDGDAATLHNLGNTDPRPGQVPAAGRLTGLWTADTATMLKRAL